MPLKYKITPLLFLFRNSPFEKKKPKFFSFLQGWLKPMVSMFENFNGFRINLNEELSYTAQSMLLELRLNIELGIPSGVFIENKKVIIADTFYYKLEEEQENSPHLYQLDETVAEEEQLYLYELGEGGLDYDFIVHVPKSSLDVADPLQQDLHEKIKAIIYQYIFWDKTFTIKSYE